MPELLRALRMLADEGRLRILRLLGREELSVAELQEILNMGQSRISMQLSQLKQAGLLEHRRVGQKSFYKLAPFTANRRMFAEIVAEAGGELAEADSDDQALRFVLERRKDQLRSYFDNLAGKFGRDYVPGRSWKSLSEMLLRLLPRLAVADLGAGEGTLSLLLAQRAHQVIAVDSSLKMVEYTADVARRNGVENVECRLGDLEDLPIESETMDIALLHQSLHHALHPERALTETWRILKPSGRVVVMDLAKHQFEDARELYGDVWLGFSQAELAERLQRAGFSELDIAAVDRETDAPQFETLLAIGLKL